MIKNNEIDSDEKKCHNYKSDISDYTTNYYNYNCDNKGDSNAKNNITNKSNINNDNHSNEVNVKK